MDDSNVLQPVISSRDMGTVFTNAVHNIWHYGANISVRGMETKEITQRLVTVAEPKKRCIMNPARKDSIVAKCAETLWMLSGRNDIEWLSRYIPQAPKYADDGLHWRGGYGPRLRRWGDYNSGVYPVDQLNYVCKLLQNDPSSRQAVLSIWDPIIDNTPGKDIPCNNWVQFILRDGQLNMSVAQRSSDVWWGFSGIDTFQWSVLQQLMAAWVDAEVGSYTHFIGSFHLYERHFKVAETMLHGTPIIPFYDIFDINPPEHAHRFYEFDDILKDLLDVEGVIRRLIANEASVDVIDTAFRSTDGYDPLLSTMTKIAIMGLVSQYDSEPIASWLDSMPISDLWITVLEWLCRKNPALLDVISQVNPTIYEFVWDYMLDGANW